MLSTGINDAFTATGGGRLSVIQDGVTVVNTIATTSGAALRVENTEIGAAGLTFRSISAGTSEPSPGAGIILDSTGTEAQNGGLTVTGQGVPQSGGLIRRKTGPDGSTNQGVGIYLHRTRDAAFHWMELTRFDNSALVGRDVVGFLLANSVIDLAGTTTGIFEGPIVFGLPSLGGVNGLVGTGIIRDTVITGGIEDNVAFYNQSGAMALSIERTTPTPGGCLIGANSSVTGRHGLVLRFTGTATGSATVSRCRIRANRDIGVLATAADQANLALLVTGSEVAFGFLGRDGIVASNADDAILTATIEDTRIVGLPGAAIRLGQSPGDASALSELRASIVRNYIESPADSVDGSIVARLSSAVGEASNTILSIADNTGTGRILQAGQGPGVLLTTPDAGTSPQIDLTFTNNHVDMDESAPGSGIRGPIGAHIQVTAGNLCANIQSNTSHWLPTVLIPQGGGIRAEQGSSGAFRLERGSQPLETAASTVLAANNPAPPSTLMVTESIGTIAVVDVGTCRVP